VGRGGWKRKGEKRDSLESFMIISSAVSYSHFAYVILLRCTEPFGDIGGRGERGGGLVGGEGGKGEREGGEK